VANIGAVRITIYAGDHNPPHFHARLRSGEEARIRISDLKVLNSNLPRSTLRPVLDWAAGNQAPLALMWVELNETIGDDE
jgi:hypothetical protein